MNSIDFCSLETPCPYLQGLASRSEHRYFLNTDFTLNSALTQRGYRRFGKFYSKPVCGNCNKCVSIRINTKNFIFSKSDKKAIKRNKDTQMFISKPMCDKSHLELYTKYHLYMNKKKGWKFYELDERRYFDLYVDGCNDFGKEISYYRDEKLICVDLIDFVQNGISSIYCYWDPEFAWFSLGKFSLLNQISFAKSNNLSWIYLGFYVKECPSLAYKGEYTPFESLQKYCELDKQPVWI